MRVLHLSEMFWPSSPAADPQRVARKRLLISLAMIIGVLGTLAGVFSFQITFENYPLQTLVGIFGPLICLSIPPLLFFTDRLLVLASVTIGVLIGLILFPALTVGGAGNPVILYLAVVPLLGSFLMGYRIGLGLAGLTIAIVLSLYVFDPILPGFPAGYNEHLAARWNTTTISLLVIGIAVLASVFQREMEQANERLKVAKQAADAGNEAKSQFLANMSHEIRTPMNGVLGMAGLLNMSTLSPQQREQVELIEKSGKLLLSLLNDILDMSKIEAGQMEVEQVEFCLSETVESVLDLHRAVADAKGIALDCVLEIENRTRFLGDPLRISQILNNLVSNAIKFTQHGRVTVCIHHDGDGVEIAVRDTGNGIPDDKLETLFDAFTQADLSTTRQHGGTGLGLSICRKLCRLMGGELTATSKLGEGSEFTARLPLGISDNSGQVAA